jgi:uncharacterized protein (DUF486 family)
MITVFLLVLSNIFMTIAWYGHLKYTSFPLWTVIIVSWLIALPEYCFQVPANRLGYGQFSGVELKTIQEIISLTPLSERAIQVELPRRIRLPRLRGVFHIQEMTIF